MAVTLQISLSPGDYPHVRYILPHQLQILAKQVDEIILTVDTRPSKGRFAEGWHTYKDMLADFLLNDIQPVFNVKIIPVDYSISTKEKVAEFFFGSKHIPDKDYRGGPFYAYFFALFQASYPLILHLDSDIFLGGGSQKWIAEAVDTFKANPDYLIVSPLPGLPHTSGILKGQNSYTKSGNNSYIFDGMSTRIFFVNRSKFQENKLSFKRPLYRSQIKSLVQGNPNIDLPEHLISNFMQKNDLKRMDFLGKDSGLWSLHPPYRTQTFYQGLQAIIANIESGLLPEGQQGFYDIIDDVCDWSEAREKLSKNRWWKAKMQ